MVEKQVVNRQLSEELKRVGFPQEGLWWWYQMPKNKTIYRRQDRKLGEWNLFMDNPVGVGDYTEFETTEKEDNYLFANLVETERSVAPTCAELIEKLGNKFGVLERFLDGGFGAYIPRDCGVNGMDKTPANALARLWLVTQEE